MEPPVPLVLVDAMLIQELVFTTDQEQLLLAVNVTILLAALFPVFTRLLLQARRRK